MLLSDDVLIGTIDFPGLRSCGNAADSVGLLAVVAMRLSIDLLRVFPTVPSLTPVRESDSGILLFATCRLERSWRGTQGSGCNWSR
jgi:hypothetical protein